MIESTTVTVGLDVHARSIRLAAVRADELLEERTLPYDEEAVARLLGRWPAVRCCYEAGPTGFGLYRYLVERGIECAVVAPGLVPQRPGDRVKTDPRDARKLARLHAGGLLEPIHVPPPEVEAARDLVRAREDARLDRMRDRHRLSKFCLRHGRLLPTTGWTVLRRKWLGEQRFEHAAEQITFGTYLHAVDLVDARVEQLERAIREMAEQGPWRKLVSRLRSSRRRHAHRDGVGGRDRRLQPLPQRRGVHGVRRSRPVRAQLRPAAPARSDHQGRQQPRPSPARRVGLARAPPSDRRLRVRRQRGQDSAAIERAWRCQQRLYQRWQRMAGPASRTRRSSSPARANSPASSGQSPPTSPSGLSDQLIQPLSLEQRMRLTTRRTLASSIRHPPPVTRDPRQRQLPTVPSRGPDPRMSV